MKEKRINSIMGIDLNATRMKEIKGGQAPAIGCGGNCLGGSSCRFTSGSNGCMCDSDRTGGTSGGCS